MGSNFEVFRRLAWALAVVKDHFLTGVSMETSIPEEYGNNLPALTASKIFTI